MINRVRLIDNMEFMKDIPNNYYDLVIDDPPYGIMKKKVKEKSKKYQKRIEKAYCWDKRPNKKYFDELLRVSKKTIIWGGNYFLDLLPFSKKFLIWDKKNPFPGRFNDFEMAYLYNIKTSLKIFFYPWLGYSRKNWSDSETIHPTQKPIALYKWLLKNYAKPGDKIFDGHVGSGSSRIACYELGFDFEGCENDKDYWEAQEQRFMEFKKKYHNEFYIPDEENLLFK